MKAIPSSDIKEKIQILCDIKEMPVFDVQRRARYKSPQRQPKVISLFGSPAIHDHGPVALRPGIATGLPLSEN